MLISYTYKLARHVTSIEKRYLSKLIIPGVGLIWDDFREYKSKKTCSVVIARNSNQIIVAWGLLYYDKSEKVWTISMFVKPRSRRKGIGSKIYRLLKLKHKLKNRNIKVFRHDTCSTSFYDSLQKRD